MGKLFSLVKSFPKPLQKHASRRKKPKTLRRCLKLHKLFEKSLTKNFIFCTWYRFSFLTTSALFSFNYNNYSTSLHGSETPVVYTSFRSVQNKRPPDVLHRTKVLCLLSFKKVSFKTLRRCLKLHQLF